MRIAGLRSDQLESTVHITTDAIKHKKVKTLGPPKETHGICREPQFQSKRRVPFNPPQVSNSLQWKDLAVSSRQQGITRPGTSPAVARFSSPEKVETPLGPRTSKSQRSLKTTNHLEDVPSSQVRSPSDDQQERKHPSNRVNHALRKKAGLKPERQRNGCQSSEYQRQFLWKTPTKESPLLAAQQMLYTSNRSIPPFKSNSVELETEYKRSFKGSALPRPPRFRQDVELKEVPLFQMANISPEKERKKRRKQHLSRKSRPKEDTHPELQPLHQAVMASQKDASPKVLRKVKTEYTLNFRSPLEYHYKDGAWVRSRVLGEEGHEWYHEVRDLRTKAEAYRRRAWGTHFSRHHLSQILSEQNCLWEASSASSFSTLTEQDNHSTSSPMIEALDLARVDSVSCSPGASLSLSTSRKSSFEGVGLSNGPTLPVQRKLAWDEEKGPCENGAAEIKLQTEEPPVQQPEESDEEESINEHSEDKREKIRLLENEPSSPSAGSRSSIEEGRLPTPKLKTMLTAQRTHHDRTTPTKGAVLASPPKTKSSSRTAQKTEAPLGKVHSPIKHLRYGSPPQTHSKAENNSLPRSSPAAAGIATVDPLPLREDTWVEPSSEPKPNRTPHSRTPSAMLIGTNSPYANRIQGMLRNSEFQHNGNLGLHRPDQFVFSSGDSGVSDNDDRMSQISSRSAASCSMASEVLDRALKRKEDFWGKS